MNRTILALIAAAFAASPLSAQQPAPPAPAATQPAATPAKSRAKGKPSPTPSVETAVKAEAVKPKQGWSLFRWLFGSRAERNERVRRGGAQPTPTATPSPTPAKPRAKATPATAPTATPAPVADEPEALPVATPRPRATPKAPKADETLGSGDVPFVPPVQADAESDSAPPATDDFLKEEARQRARYREVKDRALKDSRILELRDNADATVEPVAHAAAAKAYYKALFNKMRQIDPSITARIDRMEAATLRRLDAGEE